MSDSDSNFAPNTDPSEDEVREVSETEQFEPETESMDEEQFEQLFEQAMDQADSAEWNFEPVSIPLFGEEQVEGTFESVNSASEAVVGETQGSEEENLGEPQTETRLVPQEIVEAALFVGGAKLTVRKLRKLLNDDFDADYVEKCIQNLNELYQSEGRPYEIQLAENGYKMKLKRDFEPVRRKVFGYGPREVKLSRDALEILSLVAYHQPISKAEVDKLSKCKASGTLNQLLRRELISLHRDKETREVTYRTEQRFLDLFGIADLDDLPRAEDLTFK